VSPVLRWLAILATMLLCGLPVAWVAGTLLVRVDSLAVPGHAWVVHGRTVGLAAVAAVLATVLAWQPAAVLTRGGGGFVVVTLAAAAVLAVPEPAWAYGVAEAWRQFVGPTSPDSWADRTRAVLTVTLATWPIPAAALAVTRARLDADVLDAADLDGAKARVRRQMLLPAAVAGAGGAMLLAARSFSAYDVTGIVTTGVLVREAHALSPGKPADRAAAAVAAGLPTYLFVAAVAGLAAWWWMTSSRGAALDSRASVTSTFSRRKEFTASPDHQGGDFGGRSRAEPPPPPSRSGLATTIFGHIWMFGHIRIGVLLLLSLLLLPVLALIRTADGFVVVAYTPQLANGVLLAATATLLVAVPTVLTVVAATRIPLLLAVAAFALGGQVVAVAVLRMSSLPDVTGLAWLQQIVFDWKVGSPATFAAWPAAAVLAFLPLAVGRATWFGPLRDLRRQADVDGANLLQSARDVILPLAWPGLVTALATVFVLAMAETHAAVLTFPGSLVNTLIATVHTLADAATAEAALLAMFMAAVLAAGVLALYFVGRRVVAMATAGCLAVMLVGCDRPEAPDEVWLESGTGEAQVVYPRAIAYSSAEDVVWIVDRRARVQKLDAADGSFLLDFTMPEQRYGKPVGVGVDGEGNVWVPDTHYHRVIVYGPDGVEKFRLGQKGIGPGDFIWPTDVLVIDDGRVLVSEYGSGPDAPNDRIQLFEPDDTGGYVAVAQIGSFGTGPGQFRRPQSMVRVGDVLWVTDSANHRLLAFSLADEDLGTFLYAFGDGGPASEAGRFRFPHGLEALPDGRLLVTEFGNNRVQLIDPATGNATVWGRFGSRPGELTYPFASAWDPTRGRALVVDSGNDRIQVVRF
jgi:DNA-binding beta-propeller fold protein YncE/ABC-type glycerol-3-phosphate transport system permease component